MPKIVNSWNEWDPLKYAIVGKADNCCIPPAEPATDAKIPKDSDMQGVDGPRSEESITKANIQLDKLGFEVVPVPFRDACPFGEALHCATTDVYREGKCEDYFPNQ